MDQHSEHDEYDQQGEHDEYDEHGYPVVPDEAREGQGESEAMTGDTRDPRVIFMNWVDERIADARDELWAEFEDRIAQATNGLGTQVTEALSEMRQYIDAQDAYVMGRVDMVGTMFRDEIDRAAAKHPAGKGKAKKAGERAERLGDPHDAHVD